MWFQLEPVESLLSGYAPFLKHNIGVIKCLPGASITIYHHGFDGWVLKKLRFYFFGDCNETFPLLRNLRTSVGNLFWFAAVQPLLEHTLYRQSTNRDLALSRARGSKASNQCRFYIITHLIAHDAAPVLYLDTDAMISPCFAMNYKKYREDKAYSQRGLLIATFGRGSNRLQVHHFSSTYQFGSYQIKELVMNASVILAEPALMTEDDFAVLRAITAAYAEESTYAKVGKTIEWSAAAKRAAVKLDRMKMPPSLAPPHLFHPLSTKENSKDITGFVGDSMVVSLSGCLDEKYGRQLLDYYCNPKGYRDRSRSSRRIVKRITSSSCPSNMKATWNMIMQSKVVLLGCEVSALDVQDAVVVGKRSGLKSATLAGLRMVSKRLNQRLDK